METNVSVKNSEPLHVLLIGNNPIDLGKTLERVQQVRGRRIITEFAFDIQSILERLMRFTPNFILIDDNIGKAGVNETVYALSKSRKTKDVPITVLKNSNYSESFTSSASLDFVLKQNFTTESLYSTLSNALKFKRTQAFLLKAYQKRKSQLKKLRFG